MLRTAYDERRLLLRSTLGQDSKAFKGGSNVIPSLFSTTRMESFAEFL